MHSNANKRATNQIFDALDFIVCDVMTPNVRVSRRFGRRALGKSPSGRLHPRSLPRRRTLGKLS